MDSFKDWSVSTFKCTRQLLNEKRGTCSVTSDAQLQSDIDQLRETRNKFICMVRTAQQMNSHYSQLVRTQRQLYGLMNEMSIKCFTVSSVADNPASMSNSLSTGKQIGSKQVVANFSSLSNNLSSTTTTSPSRQVVQSNTADNLSDFSPVLNHIRSSNVNLTEDFKKNAIALNSAIKNGEKLVSALTFFSSNVSTLINKTIEDTLATVRNFEAARLEYDAERNSINFSMPAAQTSITYSSERIELSRIRYEQLKEDVQIKIKFLEDNTIKVMHKQMSLFNSAFASYSTGNTAALDATLKQFSIR